MMEKEELDRGRTNKGFPGGSVGKKICLQCRRYGVDPQV